MRSGTLGIGHNVSTGTYQEDTEPNSKIRGLHSTIQTPQFSTTTRYSWIRLVSATALQRHRKQGFPSTVSSTSFKPVLSPQAHQAQGPSHLMFGPLVRPNGVSGCGDPRQKPVSIPERNASRVETQIQHPGAAPVRAILDHQDHRGRKNRRF
jgi:hypothetical protein